MEELTNRRRAEFAAQILDLSPYDEDPDGAITDILANLMHYCNQTSNFDFDKALVMARYHFDCEREESA